MPRASPSSQRERAFAHPLHSTWSASLRCERHDIVWCEWRQNKWQPFFLPASDAEVLSGSVTDPTLLPSSSSHNARLRAHPHHEKGCQMSSGSNGPRWGAISQQAGRVFSHGALSSPLPTHFPEVHTSSRYYGTPPTCLASVLLLQLLSHLLTALKKKDTSTCLFWMSLWLHISARPQLSDGRRGQAIRPSRAEPHLDNWLQRCTLWLCSRSSRPRCSLVRKPVWMQLHSGIWGARQTWFYAPPKPPPR